MPEDFFGPFGNTLRASSKRELESILTRIDIRVPGRTDGRRSSHRERYPVVLYLLTLNRHRRLTFPLEVEKRERPDFRIDTAGGSLGLEIAEAGSEEHQRAATELEKSPAGSMLVEGTIRRPGEPLPEMRGFAGDEPERSWTREMRRIIEKKTELLQGYDELPETELLIYDNSGFAALTSWSVDELPERLAKAIAEYRSAAQLERHYSRCSVLRDRILLFDVTREALLYRVPRLAPLPPDPVESRLDLPRQELEALCRRHHIKKLGFFGSIREEGFGPDSDVDVLVEFEPGHVVGLLEMAGIEQELTDLAGRKVDLRTVRELSRYFREDVSRRTEPAYAARFSS